MVLSYRKKINKEPEVLKKQREIIIDCKKLTDDKLILPDELKDYFFQHMKIAGKKGLNPNDKTKVEVVSGNSKVTLVLKVHISKRYVKYLLKRFLNKQTLKEYVRVISCSKSSYRLVYYNTWNS